MPKPSGTISRTLILLKPDAIERNLSGEILKRFERKGLKIVASEMRWIDKTLAEKHYAEHKGNTSHFKAMTEALVAGPLMAVVLEGPAAVMCSRQLIGSQSPLYNSQVGTIRADFAIQEPYNLVHGSDSDQAAKREITLWFGAGMYKVSQPAKINMNVPVTPGLENKILPLTAPPIPKKKIEQEPEQMKAWALQVSEFLKASPGQDIPIKDIIASLNEPKVKV
jgi:nucleoside-diphosphate kinase